VKQVRFTSSLFRPVNWLCNCHCRIKSQLVNPPETSLHALRFTSRGQETLAPGSGCWRERAYEFSQTLIIAIVQVEWLHKSRVFIPASQMLQANSTCQPCLIFQCHWWMVDTAVISPYMYRTLVQMSGSVTPWLQRFLGWDILFSVRYALRPNKRFLILEHSVFSVKYRLRLKKRLNIENIIRRSTAKWQKPDTCNKCLIFCIKQNPNFAHKACYGRRIFCMSLMRTN
jgi:hypothetical protein